MNIEQFNYEVIPWIYAGKNGGEEKALIISVTINGRRYSEQKVMPNQLPWETEIEYYTRSATLHLQDMLKTLTPTKDTTT